MTEVQYGSYQTGRNIRIVTTGEQRWKRFKSPRFYEEFQLLRTIVNKEYRYLKPITRKANSNLQLTARKHGTLFVTLG